MNEDGQGRAPECAAHDASHHSLSMCAARSGAVRRFARIRREVVEVELRPAGARASRPLDHLNDLAAPDPDPEGLWRVSWDELVVDTTPMCRKGARERADLIAAVAEWAFTNPSTSIRSAGALILRALDEHRQGEPFGRALGLEPASGLVARTAINFEARNTLIRAARAAMPAWREASPRQAARDLVAAFAKYEATGWPLDRARDTAPAGDPVRAAFWRIKRSGTAMPDAPRVAQLLA